jgi:hypothetical protein
MRQSIQTAIKVLLLFLIGLTIFMYFLPMSTEIPEEILNPIQKNNKQAAEDFAVQEIALQHPDQVAVLFGWVRPTPTPTPRVTAVPTATPVPTPVTPGWLKLIGKYVENEKQYYIFKDERYNTGFTVAQGVSDKGWSLVKETSTGYLLKYNGEEYFVAK